jgi:hypothetical protein
MSLIVTKDRSIYAGYSSLYKCIQSSISSIPIETGIVQHVKKLTKPEFVLLTASTARYTKVPCGLYSQNSIFPLGIHAEYSNPQNYRSSPKVADVSSSNILVYYVTADSDGSKYIQDIHTDWILLNFVKEYSLNATIVSKRPLKMILIADHFSPLEDTGVPIIDIEGWTYITFDEIVADWRSILEYDPEADLLDFQTLAEKLHILETIGDPTVYEEKLQNEIRYREMVTSFSLEYPDFTIKNVIPVNARPNL